MSEQQARLSPCCQDTIEAALRDGILVGSCRACGKIVTRIDPQTGKQETQQKESDHAHR